MKELIKELEQYKTLNKTIDIDFVIILIKINLNNHDFDCNTQFLINKTKHMKDYIEEKLMEIRQEIDSMSTEYLYYMSEKYTKLEAKEEMLIYLLEYIEEQNNNK